MTRDEELKLKVATIINEAIGEKKRTRRQIHLSTAPTDNMCKSEERPPNHTSELPGN